MTRCGWVPEGDKLYADYHDIEWGVPLHDDQKLFEMLILEGAQAGLSWRTILGKRDGYKRLFHDFDVARCASMTDAHLQEILLDPSIVRNTLKVYSVRKNAQAYLGVQEQHGSFADYLWSYVDGSPIKNSPLTLAEIPVSTDLSDAISADLKGRGMSFVGTTIIYAYLQAVGLVDDHTQNCFKH